MDFVKTKWSDPCQVLILLARAWCIPRAQEMLTYKRKFWGVTGANAPGIPPIATWWRCQQPWCRGRTGTGSVGTFPQAISYLRPGAERPERKVGEEKMGKSEIRGPLPLCVSAGTPCPLPATIISSGLFRQHGKQNSASSPQVHQLCFFKYYIS